jgi:hypothetical protein
MGKKKKKLCFSLLTCTLPTTWMLHAANHLDAALTWTLPTTISK